MVCSLSRVAWVLWKAIKQKVNTPHCSPVKCSHVFFFFAPTFLNASPIGTPLLTLGAEGSPVAQLSFFQLLVVILLRYEFWALCLNGMLKWETAVFLRHMSLSNKDMLARHYLSIRKQCQRCGGPNEGGQKKNIRTEAFTQMHKLQLSSLHQQLW